MPELPDVRLYVAKLSESLLGEPLLAVKVLNPFVLRTVEPPLASFVGREVRKIDRIGKRIAFGFGEESWIVIHLMVSGRFRWIAPGKAPPGKIAHVLFSFSNYGLVLTEASTRKRASVHCVDDGLDRFRRSGVDPTSAALAEFGQAIQSQNRTLKRALTDPDMVDGVGNAYSDEILFAAQLSPLRLTSTLSPNEMAKLYAACNDVLETWTIRLQEEFKDKFPGAGDVTAFRSDFHVHGRYGEPCRVCGRKIQRIRYAENETNYCAQCQNEGRLLADRSLSRLLKDDWPRDLDELDSLRYAR